MGLREPPLSVTVRFSRYIVILHIVLLLRGLDYKLEKILVKYLEKSFCLIY